MAETETLSFTLDARCLEHRGQLKRCILDSDGEAIRLKDIMLFEDDAPGIGMPEGATDRSWFEKLHKGIRIRKDIVLDDPRAFSGLLLFNGLEMKDNDHPLHISINGHEFIRPPSKEATPLARQYYTRDWGGDQFDNWFFIEIPVGALNKGVNEIVMWADSEETSWEIMVADAKEFARGSETRMKHPDRSAKSRDGGATWDFKGLGWKDAHDGEYCVRLSLDRSVPEGVFISPVIDLADTSTCMTIKRRIHIGNISAKWDIDTPEGADAEIFVRFGDSPSLLSDGWSAYERIMDDNIRRNNPPGRYFQFKVAMTATNPLATPSFKGMTLITEYDSIPDESHVMCRIVDGHNRPVIRPSVDYTYEDYGKLRDIRDRFELDKVVAGAATEFEAQLKLMRWAYEIPIGGLNRYSWDYYDLPLLKRNDDGSIAMQTNYEGRRRDKHCLYCNLTLTAACLAMGYPARWVNIATRTTYGHEVTEVWSNEFDKWIFLDATRDYYIYDPDTGIPMNLVEINSRLKDIMPRPVDWEHPIRRLVPSDSLAYDVDIAYREGNNRFSITDIHQGPHLLLLKGQLHLPLRNDFASRHTPVPWRISSNWGGPLFYGYYNDIFPRKREYHLHTARSQDFNPPLNRSDITLSETDHPGVIRVDIDTVTPCFDTFIVSVDDSGWMAVEGTSVEWPLHEGMNTLRVKARNTEGVDGPESFAKIVMNN